MKLTGYIDLTILAHILHPAHLVEPWLKSWMRHAMDDKAGAPSWKPLRFIDHLHAGRYGRHHNSRCRGEVQ